MEIARAIPCKHGVRSALVSLSSAHAIPPLPGVQSTAVSPDAEPSEAFVAEIRCSPVACSALPLTEPVCSTPAQESVGSDAHAAVDAVVARVEGPSENEALEEEIDLICIPPTPPSTSASAYSTPEERVRGANDTTDDAAARQLQFGPVTIGEIQTEHSSLELLSLPLGLLATASEANAPIRAQSDAAAVTVQTWSDIFRRSLTTGAASQTASLRSLLPSSAIPLLQILRDSSLPNYLRDALKAVSTQERFTLLAKQRLSVAVICCLHLHAEAGPTSDRSRLTRLLPLDTDPEFMMLGRGLHDAEVFWQLSRLSLPRSIYSLTCKQRIDGALRVLLRAIEDPLSKHDALELLQQLEALYLPVADERRPTAVEAAAAIAPVATDAEIEEAAPPLQSATLIPVSGAGNKCAFRCISFFCGVPLNEICSRIIQPTLDSIDSAATLCSYGLPGVEWNASAAEIQQSKVLYYASDRFMRQESGGELELALAAHHSRGALAFLLLDTRTGGGPGCRAHSKMICSADFPVESGSHLAAPATSSEVQLACLHHCAYNGDTSNCSAPANHFNAFCFYTADRRELIRTLPLSKKNDVQSTLFLLARQGDRQARAFKQQKDGAFLLEQQQLRSQAQAAAQKAHARVYVSNLTAESSQPRPAATSAPAVSAANRQLQSTRPPRLKSGRANAFPTRAPICRRLTFSPTAGRRSSTSAPASRPPPRAPPAVPSSTAHFTPPSTRPQVWREIPASSRAHFLALTKPMMVAYGQYSAACDYVRCAEVLHLMLDFPAKALQKARGGYRRLKVTMEEQLTATQERLEAIRTTTAAEATVSEATATEHPAADASLLQQARNTTSSSLSAPPAAALESPPRQLQSSPMLNPPPLLDSTVSCCATAEVEDDSTDQTQRAVLAAVRKIREGGRRCISRAAQSLMQRPMATITAETLTSLRKLHPQANHILPSPPANSALDLVAVEWSKLAPLIKRRINNGAAPGPSGWTGSHLQLLADAEDREVADGLCLLVKDICNGLFSGATQQRLLACILQPVSKDGTSTNIRPIAMGEVFVKLAAHYSMSLIEEHLPALFPRIQFGVKQAGGSECAAHLTRTLLWDSAEKHADTIAVKTDFMNAFNSADRAQLWHALLKDPRTEPIWRMFHWAYSAASPLLVYDHRHLRDILLSSEGVRQGDPFAAFAFAFLVQPLYEAAIAQLPQQCHAVSIQDDVTIVGPQAAVFEAFDRVQRMAPSYHLTLRVDKCAVFIPHTVPVSNRVDAEIACATRFLSHSNQMESLGVMHGQSDAVMAHAEATVDRHRAFFAALTHRSMPVQIGLTLLRYCALPRLSYLSRTTHPLHLTTAAARFDSMVHECFRKLMKLQPTALPVEVMEQIQLPLSKGGLGLRSVLSYSPAAYFAALAVTLPEYIAATATDPGLPSPSPSGSPEAPQQMLELCWTIMQRHGVGQEARSRASAPAVVSTAAIANTVPHPSSRSTSTRAERDPSSSINFLDPAESVLPRLWRQASNHARRLQLHRSSPSTHPHPNTFLQFEQLQKEATVQREERQLSQIHARSTPFRQALLTAAAAPHATAFLTALPTQSAYTLDDESMRLAVRHRLGLPASDALFDQSCVCGVAFASDPDHFHSCVQTRSSSLTKRHDALVHTLASLAHEAGWLVTVEPNQHLRPVDHSAATTATARPLNQMQQHTAEAETAPGDHSDLPAHYNRHGDLLLLRHSSKLYIDLSLTRPTNASTLRYQPRVASVPLLSTHLRAASKKRKYAAIAAVNQYEMLPFVMETYGGLGADANRVLRYFAASSTAMNAKEFMSHAHASLSVALQRGNAHVSLLGQQSLHWRRQLRHRGERFREAANRARHYAELGSAQRLAYQLQPEISQWKEGGEQEAETTAATAAAELSHPHPFVHLAAPSFTHSRLSCIADSPAVWSDCDSDFTAEDCRSATAEERGLQFGGQAAA